MAVTCLIVDDHADFLAAATRLLVGQGVDVVGVASTAAAAVARALATPPDVALVDVGLGDDDGFELADQLASLPERAPKVILISGDAPENFGERIAASAAIGFIAKIDLSAAEIEKLLRASS